MPGKSYGQRRLVGYSPWGGKESDTTERLHQQALQWPRSWEHIEGCVILPEMKCLVAPASERGQIKTRMSSGSAVGGPQRITFPCIYNAQVAQMVKNLPAMAEDLGSISGSGRSPGEGNGDPPAFLPGKSHGQRSLVGYKSMGSQRVRYD